MVQGYLMTIYSSDGGGSPDDGGIEFWDVSDPTLPALVVRVDDDGLTVMGTIRNPAVERAGGYGTGIQRTLVIGSQLWTMSSAGLQISDLHSLDREAWVPFR
jgi:hypothetical protein